MGAPGLLVRSADELIGHPGKGGVEPGAGLRNEVAVERPGLGGGNCGDQQGGGQDSNSETAGIKLHDVSPLQE